MLFLLRRNFSYFNAFKNPSVVFPGSTTRSSNIPYSPSLRSANRKMHFCHDYLYKYPFGITRSSWKGNKLFVGYFDMLYTKIPLLILEYKIAWIRKMDSFFWWINYSSWKNEFCIFFVCHGFIFLFIWDTISFRKQKTRHIKNNIYNKATFSC